MLSLKEEFIVKEIPGTCYYIPNFITEAEEKLLIHDIIKTPVNLRFFKSC